MAKKIKSRLKGMLKADKNNGKKWLWSILIVVGIIFVLSFITHGFGLFTMFATGDTTQAGCFAIDEPAPEPTPGFEFLNQTAFILFGMNITWLIAIIGGFALMFVLRLVF